MLQTLDWRGRDLTPAVLRAALPRASFDLASAAQLVQPIIAEVRARGGAALREYAARFDGVSPPHVRVPAATMAAALDALDPDVRTALTTAIQRARLVHAAQLPTEHTTEVTDGGRVSQRWIPVDRVGLYVPGGLAVYPSSVVMNVVPALIAGVGSVAVASPPQRDNQGEFAGYPHPVILAACALLGVDEVYAMGGAQAIAGFAFGFTDGDDVCEPVSVVTGPGNIYVASAKRELRGIVGIDAEAGPTEIAILADATADPELVASDLVSQAEHDPLAACVLVTDSPELAQSAADAAAARAAATKHSQRVIEALRGEQSAVVLVDDLDAGLAVVNAYGAEHLEIQTADAAAVADRVRNAGAIFVGAYAPVSLGDYAAGSNHVLPTGGSSRHSSGLNVLSFLRSVQVIDYSADALADIGPQVVTLAESEDLPAHGEAITARIAR